MSHDASPPRTATVNMPARVALATSLVYWAAASMWILFSDRALVALASDQAAINASQTYKGWAFISITAGLLYVALHAQLRRWHQESVARRRVEDELRESERWAASIVASAMDAILTINAEQRVVLFNKAAETMFGIPAAEAIGAPLGRFIPEQYRAIHADHVLRFMEHGTTLRKTGRLMELYGLRGDGTEFPIEAAISKVAVGDGVLATVIVRDVSERRDLLERVRLASQHDPLTKLPNRALIFEHAEQRLTDKRRAGDCTAFLFIDLDRFKAINDNYGHDVGDAVLRETAVRLTGNLREEDFVGRLGGDEFIAILSNMHCEDDAARVARHLLGALGQPYLTNELELNTSPSIGISLFPQDGASAEELIKHADTAMYHAKQAGRNGFRFYRPGCNRQAQPPASDA